MMYGKKALERNKSRWNHFTVWFERSISRKARRSFNSNKEFCDSSNPILLFFSINLFESSTAYLLSSAAITMKDAVFQLYLHD
jgi:hypothetical protein